MTKIATTLVITLVVAAGAMQSIAIAEDHKSASTDKPVAPATRPAPAVRSAAPPSRPAPLARPVTPPQHGPTVQQAPVAPRAPATTATPNAPERIVEPRNATPHAAPSATAPNRSSPNVSGTTGSAARAIPLNSIRGANRAAIAGQNFTVRRGSYRAYRDGHWRTFVGLSALSAILIGASYYYPYAYIDAPVEYCRGWTEDGCELSWQAVPTVEGPVDYQCVAYCPWQ